MIYHTKYNDFYSENGLPYLIDFISELLHPYQIIFWKPKKNLWVIQAKWSKVEKVNELTINSEILEEDEDDEDEDEKSNINFDNNNFLKFLDYTITSDITYSNNSVNHVLPAIDYNKNSYSLNILPNITEYKKNI